MSPGPYCVVRDHHVAARGLDALAWLSPADAWYVLHLVHSWDTEKGAQLFADMNGGNVTEWSVFFNPPDMIAPLETKQPTDPEPQK